MKHGAFIGLILILATLLVGCGAVEWYTGAIGEAASPAAVAFDEALYDQGVAVYLSSYCGTCHMLDAAGTFGNFGPGHNQAALEAEAHLADPGYSGSATTVEDYLRESIVDPRAYYTPGYATTAHAMPVYDYLPEEDIAALVYLLAQQR